MCLHVCACVHVCAIDVKMPFVYIALAQVTLGVLSANMHTELFNSFLCSCIIFIFEFKFYHSYQIESVNHYSSLNGAESFF